MLFHGAKRQECINLKEYKIFEAPRVVENNLMKKSMWKLSSTSFLYGWKDPIFIFIGFSFTAFGRSCLLKFNFVDYLFFGGVYDMCIDIRINCRFGTCTRSTIKIVFITYLSNYVPSTIQNSKISWDTRKCSCKRVTLFWRFPFVSFSTVFKFLWYSVENRVGRENKSFEQKTHFH